MARDRERLNAALEELQAELEEAKNIDPALQERLQRTIDEIHQALEEPETVEQHSFADRLSEGVNHFEETHPNLAGMLGSVIDALGRMGI